MKIMLNGKEEFIEAGMTLDVFINLKGYNPEHIIIVYNSEIVSRESLAGFKMKDNDKIDLVKFVGGG
ncbi:hypothetical protein Pmgp_02307 [Pelotomaculum propionicicum]|uniref:Sulfur carrier protein ThiS n=2 Tax=Pelotomaculum propionicicum TaxID=258475 RepID=A0A4Y7RNE0_9FIRM|nr:sulfur carrier protein ThiS [Peptococcaceae bacterium]TEB10508.1 hypothetical protein Pmgp_02307 [Pelotomaculum propionicicum]